MGLFKTLKTILLASILLAVTIIIIGIGLIFYEGTPEITSTIFIGIGTLFICIPSVIYLLLATILLDVYESKSNATTSEQNIKVGNIK